MCYFFCLWCCNDYPTSRGLRFFEICCIGKMSGYGHYVHIFFVYSYSHAASIDHSGVHFLRVSRPQSARGGSLQAPLCPPPRPVPRKNRYAPKKETKRKRKKSVTVPYSSRADAMNGGVGRNSGGSSPAPASSSALSCSCSILSRSSLVCEGAWHHQHWGPGRFLAQCRYCPVRQCPAFSW